MYTSAYQNRKQIRAAESAAERRVESLAEQQRLQRLKNHENFCDAARDGDTRTLERLLPHVEISNPCVAYKGKCTALYLAASENRVDVVKILLRNGVDLNRGSTNASPLWAAASNGHHDIVQLLVNADANKEQPGLNDSTPLAVAAKAGFIKVVEIFIQAKANLESRDSSGNTPLIRAVSEGHIRVVEALLEAGADPNQVDGSKKPPIFIAATKNDFNMVEILLKHEASVTVEFNGLTPLGFALRFGKFETAQLLHQYEAPHQMSPQLLNDSFQNACKKGQLGIAQLLVTLGADPATDLTSLNKALESACLYNRLEDVKLLISFGAETNPSEQPIRSKGTPLMMAAYKGALEVCSYLLEEGAEVTTRDASKHTALSYALQENHPAVVRMLFPKGTWHDLEKKVLLQNAISFNQDEMVKALHELGVDIHQKLRGNLSPLNFALIYGKDRSAKALFELGLEPQNPPDGPLSHELLRRAWGEAAPERNLQFRGLCVLLTFRPHLVNECHDGDALLHKAVKLGDSDAIEFFLEIEEVDLNPVNLQGQTPLHLAAVAGDVAIATNLLNAGAELQARDQVGNTPLLLAACFGHIECVKYLIDQEANLEDQSEIGADIVWMSCVSGHLQLLEFLRDQGVDLAGSRTYDPKLSKDLEFGEEDKKRFQRNAKAFGIEKASEAISIYEKELEDRWKFTNKTRGPFVSILKEKLEEYRNQEAYQLGDVVALLEKAKATIIEKKLHSRWKGPESSTLFQELSKSLNEITGLSDVVRNNFEKDHKNLMDETFSSSSSNSLEDIFSDI